MTTSELFTFLSSNPRFRVSVGYKRPGMEKVFIVHRKIQSSDRPAILKAVEDIKSLGTVQEATIQVYRPNGSNAEVLAKTFLIPLQNLQTQNLGSIAPTTLFPEHKPIVKTSPQPRTQHASAPTPQPINTMESQSWKDYALRAEQDKNAKLERELSDLKAENKTLDLKVREFEKDMIKKDHELEKAASAVESKSSLNGVVSELRQSPQMMTVLAAAAGKLMGMNPSDLGLGQMQQLGSQDDGASTFNTTAGQYANNIRQWLENQDATIQEAVFNIFVAISESKDPEIFRKLMAVLQSSKDNQIHLRTAATN